MTYLELINGVLRRLRENTVATAAETDYSRLIGELVNDAKKTVEKSWEWSALRNTVTLNTVSGTFTYALTGAGQDSILKDAMNDTSNLFLRQRTKTYFNTQFYNATPASGTPNYFTFNSTDANGDIQVDVYPKPDGVYALRFDLVTPQADLTADATALKCPSNPVLQLAYGMALRERGETGGQSAQEQFGMANIALSDAIAIDANKYPDEMTFQAC
ncbi:MAG: hypothetical protein CMM76_16155 [Rhodospirillaceae bacterium]|nr:hypothetical protein [Rhodospirillaceae bacterium]|tara:strand:- start:109 stop:756 length:648 start_codon:yes stop_codon:yes gene_type:complete